ncbi:MAG: class I SAM-dependent methyltransferase [Phycisphaerae bacterium]|nr:class I SAM-dependent methyltransferase [Phycisphaerae bacterium]
MLPEGHYQTGQGEAGKHLANHDSIFNCRMVGTFNILCNDSVLLAAPTIIPSYGEHYWLVKINGLYGWAYRWRGSGMPRNMLEVVSKRPFPASFKTTPLYIDVLDKWLPDKVREWASNRYWFQTFPWTSHVPKSDSKLVWDTLNCIDWRGLSVLDYGCSDGYFSFEASKSGACVTGFDVHSPTIEGARTINDHIESQDVVFTTKEPEGRYDTILYLSVHHQRDSEYLWLDKEIARLRKKARKYLFVELHVEKDMSKPPVCPIMAETEIDKIVGGKILARYKHRLRGVRKIYRLDL